MDVGGSDTQLVFDRVPIDLANLNWQLLGIEGYTKAAFFGYDIPTHINETLTTGGGSGANSPPYTSTVSSLSHLSMSPRS
jgi:hypothetical protein